MSFALTTPHASSRLPLLPQALSGGSGAPGGLGYLGFPASQAAFRPQSYSIKPFRGPQTTLERMAHDALGARGERSMEVRQFTEWALRAVQPKDYLGEILAIRNVFVQPSPWVKNIALFHYTNDPRHVEMVKDPQRQ